MNGSDFELPTNLVQAAGEGNDVALVARGTAAVPRRSWMAELPVIVHDVAQRRSLELERPFLPGGVALWVAPARNRAGKAVVLKVAWLHDEAIHEADGLRAWRGNGAVRLLDATVIGDTTSVLLLEACQPGIALSHALPPPEQDEVVAALLRRLWIEPPSTYSFRPLREMCDWWADEFENKYATAKGYLLDRGMAQAGVELFRTLPATAERSVLLCTDLHPANVLAARREAWLAIDPKPYVGDPTYLPLQHMLNFPDRLTRDPVGFVDRVANLLDLDPERLRQWLFARCVQGSIDQPHLIDAITSLAP